ncbi:hypothetical protein CF319_g3459 [Tilletia indica]|nr:hypothetical protein CF319_g3459 [Tilletia indica]
MSHQHTADAAGGGGGGEYAFKSPYSQSSYDHHPTTATADTNEHGFIDSDPPTTTTTKERAELYSNTLNNTPNDYPTKSHTPIPLAGDGSSAPAAAYGRTGIWTHKHKSAFQRRSTPVKLIRSLCCVIIITLIIVLSAVLLIITFARPPNVAIGAITSNQTIPTLGRTTLSFNMTVDITVANPNAISATITELEAVGYDQVRPTVPIGQGKITNVIIDKNANTTFTLPFLVSYDSSSDGDRSLITDIATKCGWLSGTSPSNLDFTFKMNAHLSVLSLAIPFSFAVSPSFKCPISAGSISSLLGQAGGSLDDILKGLGIGGRSLEEVEDAIGKERRLLLTKPDDISLTLRDLQLEHLLTDWRKRAAGLIDARNVKTDL